MSIDFKGYKYAVVTIQGGIVLLTNNQEEAIKSLRNKLQSDAWEYFQNPDYKEEKQMDSIYTQEMYEAGELPKVGMNIEFKRQAIAEDYKKGFVVGLSKDGEWLYFHDDENYVNSHNVERGVYSFKPIDTRTDREKAVDDVANTLKANGHEDSVLAICIINSLVDIKALTFTENKNEPRNETK